MCPLRPSRVHALNLALPHLGRLILLGLERLWTPTLLVRPGRRSRDVVFLLAIPLVSRPPGDRGLTQHRLDMTSLKLLLVRQHTLPLPGSAARTLHACTPISRLNPRHEGLLQPQREPMLQQGIFGQGRVMKFHMPKDLVREHLTCLRLGRRPSSIVRH